MRRHRDHGHEQGGFGPFGTYADGLDLRLPGVMKINSNKTVVIPFTKRRNHSLKNSVLNFLGQQNT
jgi:hypothetical protein